MAEEQEQEQGQGDPGFLSRIALTLALPSRAFTAVDRAPGTWWQPLLLLAIVNAGVVFVLYDRVIVPGELEAMTERGLEGEELARARSFIESGIARALAVGAAALGTAIAAFAAALVMHAVAGSLLGGRGDLVRTWAVMCHALLVGLPEHAATIPVMLAERSLEVSFGPALFFPAGEPSPFLFNLLMQLDVFSVWMVALLGIGLAIVHRIGRAQALTASFLLWGLWAVAAAALGSAFGR